MADGLRLPERYKVRETLRDDEAEFLARAEDAVLHREVLLKAPGPGLRRHLMTTHDVDRVMREARALAKLRHDNIVRLLEIEDCPGGPVLVLEPVAGESLEERVARTGPLPADELLRVARGLAAALTAVHTAGAIHRGVAPENVMLDSNGTAVLVGFGFAKFAASGFASSIVYRGDESTRSAQEPALPLPRFPAPEQLLGHPADARSDLFALGSTLYRAASGHNPFPALLRTGWTQPKPLPKGSVPAAFEQVILRMIARSPLQRFQNAAEAEQALAKCETPASGAKGSLAHRGRLMGAIAGAAASVALVVLVTRNFSGEGGSDVGKPSGESDTRGSRLALAGGDDRDNGFAPRYANSHALLIGIGDSYAANGWDALANAERDVEALAARLTEMTWEKWDVRRLIGASATKQGVLDEVAKLLDAGRDDRILIYFAGHGERDSNDKKSGWLIPADGKARRSAADENGWISYDELNGKIRRMKAKHVLLMLDCCFGGVMTRFRSGADSSFGELMLREKAHLVLASGRPNQRVPDGEGKHSPFLEAFLGALRSDKPELTASQLYAQIQETAPRGGGTAPMFSPLEDGGTGDVVFFLRPPQ